VPGAKVFYRHVGSGSLSYVGRSNRKIDAHLLGMRLQISTLRSLEDSERVRAACLHHLQTCFFYFYPERPDLVEQMRQLAADLGGELQLPRLSWKYAWIGKLLGFATAKHTQFYYNQGKSCALRAWDKLMHSFESHKQFAHFGEQRSNRPLPSAIHMRTPMKIKGSIRRLLKRSSFIVSAVRTARVGVDDIKKLYGFMIRSRKIERYFGDSAIRKVQLGTSHSLIAGWLNTDLLPSSPEVVYLDATRRFPFKDSTIDYVFSEHVIEHVEYQSALAMLRECYRVLKPGGKIRMSTPDLRVLVGLLSSEKTASQNFYIDFAMRKFLPDITFCKEVFVINNAFRAWGHQFLYDRQTIETTMRTIGFENIRFYRPGESPDENLRGLESHGRVMECEEFNQFEAFAIEGDVPAYKKLLSDH
jgi:predicted SAM-dependent methyltransferase